MSGISLPTWVTSPEAVFSFASAAAAWVAAIYAISSARTAKRQFRLTRKQEARRSISLIGNLGRSYYEAADDSHRYIFPLIVRNPSDMDNALVRAELWIGYSRNDGSNHVVKIPQDNRLVLAKNEPGESLLNLPVPLGAREAVSGALGFTVPIGLLKECNVEDLTLKLEDSVGAIVDIAPILVNRKEST